MRKAYKTLTWHEYTVLNKIARKTRANCWFVIKQDCYGTDYIYDEEERKRMCLRTGVSMLVNGIDCQENFDNCWLEQDEKLVFKNLLEKLRIELDSSVDWKI